MIRIRNKIRTTLGFTMVELLVVLVIIGILAAVATPMFNQNTQRARASEAVATMSQIRQMEREFSISNNNYLEFDYRELSNPQNAANNPGLGLIIGTVRYFSKHAFQVTIAANVPGNDPAQTRFQDPDIQDFLINVDGSESIPCDAPINNEPAECGDQQDQVDDFRLEMDNSGRVFVCYDTCNDPLNWTEY